MYGIWPTFRLKGGWMKEDSVDAVDWITWLLQLPRKQIDLGSIWSCRSRSGILTLPKWRNRAEIKRFEINNECLEQWKWKEHEKIPSKSDGRERITWVSHIRPSRTPTCTVYPNKRGNLFKTYLTCRVSFVSCHIVYRYDICRYHTTSYHIYKYIILGNYLLTKLTHKTNIILIVLWQLLLTYDMVFFCILLKSDGDAARFLLWWYGIWPCKQLMYVYI